MPSDKITIQLNIDSKFYQISVNREDEEVYRKATKLIAQKLDSYKASFYTDDKHDYQAMVMLDLAVALVSEGQVDDRLKALVNKLDNALGNK